MAVLHLELQIDSDVHPELYEMLSAVGRSASRGERLRQLASTGLIWEQLRLPARVNIGVGADVPASDGVDTPSADQAAEVMLRQATPPGGAISGPSPRHGDVPPRALPVLRDAVDGQDIPPLKGAVSGRRSASAPAAPRNKKPQDDTAATRLAMSPTAGSVAVSESPGSGLRQQPSRVPDGESTSGAGSGHFPPPPARKTGTRSRLLRMKEKGLFNNA